MGQKQRITAISDRLVGHRGGGGFGVLCRETRKLMRAFLSAEASWRGEWQEEVDRGHGDRGRKFMAAIDG